MVISLWYVYSLGLKVMKAAITVISSAYLGLPHFGVLYLNKVATSNQQIGVTLPVQTARQVTGKSAG